MPGSPDDPKPQVEKSQIELVSDEDWKSKVKAEDVRLDEERSGKSPDAASRRAARSETRVEADEMQLPPPGIDSIIQLFLTQAMVAMGIVPGPDGKFEHQLPLARHFIDLLGVLEEKTRGNLSAQEAKLLSASLHELRMAFVQQSKKG